MRYFVSTSFRAFVRCELFTKHIKTAYSINGQSLRFAASLDGQIKYFYPYYSDISVATLLSHHKENSFSHQILESKPKFNVVSFSKTIDDLLRSNDDHDVIQMCSDPNLKNLSTKDFLNVFKIASVDAATKTLKPISDVMFNNLSDALVSKVHEFSDEDLISALLYLSLWPMTESTRSNNFNKIWKALDDRCCERKKDWSFNKILYFIDLWYLLKLTRASNFVFYSILILHKKINQLTPAQIIQVLFYLNTIRTLHKGITMYNFEYKMENFIKEITLEEIGVALLGFFKTHTSLKNENLVKYIIDRTIDEIGRVPEITLASILKCLRLSLQIKVWKELPRLLDAVTPHLDKYSLQCLTHVALLTAPSQTFHPPSLDSVSQRLIVNIKESRLKDMEKVLFPLSRLNYDPNTDVDVYKAVVDELSSPSRQEEINVFPKSFIALLHCLALHSVLPYHLIAKALDMNFITKAYGPRKYGFGRELAFIDTCLELEGKDYKGPRLPSDIRSYLYRRHSHYAPDVNFKMSRHAKFAHDVMQTVQTVFGKKSAKYLYTVPCHPRPDVVFRTDGLPEDFVSIPDYEGPVMAPTEGKTHCIVIVSKNMICPYTDLRFNGETVSKLKSIKLLGYIPKLVFFYEWPLDKSLLEKEQLLKEIMLSNQV